MTDRDGTEIAHSKAKEILNQFGIGRAPIPIPKIARGLGLTIEYTPLDTELSGMALVENNKRLIWVNALHHPNRQRFTIAHEIGHHLLHKDILEDGVHVDKGVLRRDTTSSLGTEKFEIEANAFASEFLMPTTEIQKALGDKFDLDDHDKLEALARKFKVSLAAMQYRLMRL